MSQQDFIEALDAEIARVEKIHTNMDLGPNSVGWNIMSDIRAEKLSDLESLRAKWYTKENS